MGKLFFSKSLSNTSPIWNLASLERLDLLHDQFPDVRIPQDVLNELQVGYEYPEMARIQQAIDAQWLTVESITNSHVQQSLMLDIDRGEAAAIALALRHALSWMKRTDALPQKRWDYSL